MSWESTIIYYQGINRLIRERLGGLNSASLLIESYNFSHIAELQRTGDWEALGRTLCLSAVALERAGADAIAICANTMHKVADVVTDGTHVPLIDLRDAVGAAAAPIARRAGLLGTQFTMEQPFFRDVLQDRWGLSVVTPGESRRQQIHGIIYEELCQGIVREESREILKVACHELVENGAETIILGCTELPMLLSGGDVTVPLLDTTTLHAEAIVRFSLDGVLPTP